MNLKKLLTKSLMLLTIILLGHLAVSCSDTETTDSSNFTLHYYGVTDIGPSMSYDLQAPSYIGGEPYDFAITNVTLNGESHTSESFTIDETTGEIHIQNTANLNTGLYSISVSCYSNGNYFEFKDAVKVNMLLAVPEGISVTPEEVIIKLDDPNYLESSAQVCTEEGTHVSITDYAIAEDDSKDYIEYFKISKTGKITINAKHKDKLVPGAKYVLSLKLTTKAGDHLYSDAITFNIISKPLNLLYTPNFVKIEQGATHESQLPSIQGSTEEMKFTIKSVTPETDAFIIDETTGKISLSKENSLTSNDVPYTIDINVSNQYGDADFKEAYSVLIVPYIEPIKPETFKYNPAEIYQGTSFAQKVEEGIVGDEILFDFAESNSEDIKTQIKKKTVIIDKLTGDITINNNNSLAPSEIPYEIKVKVTNAKGDATSIFLLTIKANPNHFNILHYGNNLNLAPKENYASQYEVNSKAELAALTLTPIHDINPDIPIKWEVVYKPIEGDKSPINALKGVTIDKDGVLNFAGDGWVNNIVVGMIVVKATVGEGDIAYSKTTPVFVRFNSTKHGFSVKYNPFVFQVNPQKGINRSVIPNITIGTTEGQGDFIMDYRKNFNFFNVDIKDNPNEAGLPSEKGFLKTLWDGFYNTNTAYAPNYGAKKPMSYYDDAQGFVNSKNLNKLLGYVDKKDLSVVINGNLWKDSENKYINGVLIAKMTALTDGNETNINSGKEILPIAIWLDENF